MSASSTPAVTAPPLLGEHTDTVLSDVLGLDAGRLAALRTASTI
jgi:formyl-CoA transferase